MAKAPLTSDPLEGERNRVQQIVDSKQYLEDPELLPWYKKDLEELEPATRTVFEKYTAVPPTDVDAHIKHVRDEAFKVFPYPCLGHWGFLSLSIGQASTYNEVLGRLKDGEKLLDIGCCMGQDIRKLVHDGAPSENIYASDLKKEFWDFGYDLFLDKSTLKTQFIQADIFDDNSGLKELDGVISIVHAASFFHLFDWNDQVRAAKKIIQILKPEPGSLIFGRQGGKPDAGDFSQVKKGWTAFWHNEESWAKLWKQVGDETGTKWDVEAVLGGEDMSKKMKTALVPAGTRYLSYSVRRV